MEIYNIKDKLEYEEWASNKENNKQAKIENLQIIIWKNHYDKKQIID